MRNMTVFPPNHTHNPTITIMLDDPSYRPQSSGFLRGPYAIFPLDFVKIGPVVYAKINTNKLTK